MALYDAQRRWILDAGCRGQPAGLLFPDSPADLSKRPTRVQRPAIDKAKEICQACPVMRQCRAATYGETYGVWGGLDQHERWLFRRELIKAAKRWPKARRLRWGKELHFLRYGSSKVRPLLAIQRMTGIPTLLAGELIEEWGQHLAARKAAEEAAAAAAVPPEPEAEVKEISWPDRPGRFDMWVHRDGEISDALYRGDLPDGRIRAAVRAGRDKAFAHLDPEDVRFYRPVPRYLIQYVNGRASNVPASGAPAPPGRAA